MQSILAEKLRAYILNNNPELVLQLQANSSVSQYIKDKVNTVLPLVENLLGEERPAYIIEELCMNEMTADLKPSKYNYIKNIFSEEFVEQHDQLLEAGVLTYEIINLIEACKDCFESFEFSEETEDNRFLRYAVIAAIQDYFN